MRTPTETLTFLLKIAAGPEGIASDEDAFALFAASGGDDVTSRQRLMNQIGHTPERGNWGKKDYQAMERLLEEVERLPVGGFTGDETAAQRVADQLGVSRILPGKPSGLKNMHQWSNADVERGSALLSNLHAENMIEAADAERSTRAPLPSTKMREEVTKVTPKPEATISTPPPKPTSVSSEESAGMLKGLGSKIHRAAQTFGGWFPGVKPGSTASSVVGYGVPLTSAGVLAYMLRRQAGKSEGEGTADRTKSASSATFTQQAVNLLPSIC